MEIAGNRAKIRIDKSTSCKECGKAQAGICGKSGEGMVMEAGNTLHAREGDRVTLGLKKSVQVKAYVPVFIFPVVSLFLCAYLGDVISVRTNLKGLNVILEITGLVITIIVSLCKMKNWIMLRKWR
ncbi:MAG: SoxR reducing system RseC family protein [Nitrospiraceae bacterium]|nr:MAG: SoxR reducing system RseC family protein [Nitrospiraceae bacterium]